MKRCAAALLVILLSLAAWPILGAQEVPPDRKVAGDHFKAGRWKEAFDHYKQLCADPKHVDKPLSADFQNAVQCLRNLGQENEIDGLIDSAVTTHPNDWRLLQRTAWALQSGSHWGAMIDGQFHRGNHRGRVRYVNAWERDRVRSLSFYRRALAGAQAAGENKSAARIAIDFAGYFETWGQDRVWRMQIKTDLETIPDYEDGYGWFQNETRGAPVDAEGNPVFYVVPETFEQADSDGQRFRSLLALAQTLDPNLKNETSYRYANFLWQQFGVQTMASIGYQPHWGLREDDDKKDQDAPLAVHTLKENETLARLANGVKRFALAPEHNFVDQFRKLAEGQDTYAKQAQQHLGQLFENRRQYQTASAWWQRAGNADRVLQINGRWGTFEPTRTHAAGGKPAIDFRYRNAPRVDLKAYPIQTQALLEATRDYITSNPQEPDWQKMHLSNLGWRLVNQDLKRFVADAPSAEWSIDLKPDDRHWDRRITVDAPLQQAGVSADRHPARRQHITRDRMGGRYGHLAQAAG